MEQQLCGRVFPELGRVGGSPATEIHHHNDTSDVRAVTCPDLPAEMCDDRTRPQPTGRIPTSDQDSLRRFTLVKWP
ncbi:hypothetical protein LSAT2_002074 [Lamellibrachia satsuma]|nr:hypothetical protein LSAT2_002074 [Lamellibrachia satsuma]